MGIYIYFGLAVMAALLGYLFGRSLISKDNFVSGISLGSVLLGGIIIKIGLSGMPTIWAIISILSAVAISSLFGARLGIQDSKKTKL